MQKKSLVFFGTFLLFFLPSLYLMLGPTGLTRFQGTSVFQDYKPHERFITLRTTDWLNNDNKSVTLFHPEVSTYFQNILIGYLSHFRPDFLVANNTDPKINYVPQVGLMYLWELPFLLFGLSHLLHQRSKINFLLLFGWFVTAPVAASVTNNLPSSIRTAAFLPVLQILTAVGTLEIVKRFKFIWVLLLPVFIYLFALYLHMLFVHAPVVNSKSWYYGYKDMVVSSQQISNDYDKIIVSTKLDVPHIFFLFFLNYNPATYQQAGGTISGGFSEERNHLDKYTFRKIDWENDRQLHKALLIATPAEFPPTAKVIKEIFNLDGSPSILFVDEKK